MRYLLDSAVLLAFLRGRAGAVARISPWLEADEAATCVVCYAEVVERLQGLPNYPQNVAAIRQLLRTVRPLALTYAALEQYASIRRILRPLGQLIGDMDTLIASVAVVNQLIVVTVDQDFLRVPGIEAIVWTKEEIMKV